MHLNRRKASLLALGLCLSAGLSGQPKSVGASFSVFDAGLTYQHWSSANSYHEIALKADYVNVAFTPRKTPGVTLSYLHAFDVVTGRIPSGETALHVAPGVCLGYVDDFGRNGHGFTGGVVLDVGVEFRSLKGVTVAAGVNPTLSAFVSRQDSESPYMQMKLWRNGLMRSVLPYVRVALNLPPSGVGTDAAAEPGGLPDEGAVRHSGKMRLMSFSLEWGGAFNAFYRLHNNYVTNEGSRVDIRDNGLRPDFNADILASAGFNLTTNLNLSVTSGYQGLQDGHRIIPLTLRGSWFFGDDPGQNRWFAYVDGGIGFRASEYIRNFISPLAKTGFGYRLVLGEVIKLDFSCGFQYCHLHPDLFDADGQVISPANLRRNNLDIAGVRLGMALAF